ncbi:MAG: Ig-like domain-containing protein [Arenicellales bacterium WSBS_2016_MAG_OTU3]
MAYAAPDTTEPTVTLTGPDPATFSNTEAFVVTAAFSENVTGFDDMVTDITVTNGTATVPVAVGNSETTYTLTITPDGTNGDIEISILAGAAMVDAGNPNTESETLTVAYTASADTKAAITGFMLNRANKLARNQQRA